MLRRRQFILGLAASLVLLTLTACGFVGPPPEECSVKPVNTSADPAAFAQHFTQMALLADGQVPPRSEEAEAVAAPTQTLEIVTTAVHDVPTNLCITERKGPGAKKLYDQTLTLPQGESRTRIGSFSKGPYKIQVTVDSVNVRNLTFEVR